MARRNRTRFAGSWYSRDSHELQDQLERYVDGASVHHRRGDSGGEIVGAVLPHAGLSFSGRGIAHAFIDPRSPYTRVLILSPSHYRALPPQSLVIGGFDTHETPLGELRGSPELVGILQRHLRDAVTVDDDLVEREHGTEMFLPFIRRFAPDARVALILVPPVADPEVMTPWAQAIQHVLEVEERGADRTLVIMSSDFSHYGDRFRYTPYGPATGDSGVIESVGEDDRSFARSIAAGDIDRMWLRMQRPITVCGRFPIILGLKILDIGPSGGAAGTGEVVDYYNSHTVTGRDDSNFVCYASIIFRRREVSNVGNRD